MPAVTRVIRQNGILSKRTSILKPESRSATIRYAVGVSKAEPETLKGFDIIFHDTR